MTPRADDRLDCWDPASLESFRDLPGAGCPLDAEREQTGLCGEAQADGVPCVDSKRLCELCGRAHERVSQSGGQGEPTCPSAT